MDTTPLQPTLEEVRALAAQPSIRRVPVKRELFADRITTIEAMRALRAASNHCFLLESAEADQRWGRYSFLGFNPTLDDIQTYNIGVTIKELKANEIHICLDSNGGIWNEKVEELFSLTDLVLLDIKITFYNS